MNLTMASSPHNHSLKSVNKIMLSVMLACIPGIIAQVYFFGYGVLVQLFIALVSVSISELVVLKLRNRPLWATLSDGSAWLTGLLLAISIPPLAPWWTVLIGSIFAIVIVKQLYGGLGFNLFNPAMAAYVLLLISFPVQMTTWLPVESLLDTPLTLLEHIYLIFFEETSNGLSLIHMTTVDGVTMATPLDGIKTAVSQNITVSEAMLLPIYSEFAGKGWQWVNFAYLMGGLYLIKSKIINWHIPVAFITSLSLLSTIGYVVAPGSQTGIVFNLFSGATMLGAFFIATDPVSACTTNKGRTIFGAGIGAFVYLIRHFGGFPDAVAFAVLMMNMAVPLIDHYNQPRTYGHGDLQ